MTLLLAILIVWALLTVGAAFLFSPYFLLVLVLVLVVALTTRSRLWL